MFTYNKYTRAYFDIVNRAKGRTIDGYTELHHIIPKCLGGSNENENLVSLTAKEHYVCHHLLTRMVRDNAKIQYGFIMMSVENPRQNRDFRITSSAYAEMKRYNSEIASKKFKGKQKHNAGKRIYHDPITEQTFFLFEHDPKTNTLIHGKPPSFYAGNKHKLGVGVYCHDPITKIVKRVVSQSLIPEGWIKGNPQAATKSSVGTVMFHNPLTGEQRRFKNDESISEEWVKGSSNVWITDGITERMIVNGLDIIPDQWYIGRCPRTRKPKRKK